MRQGSLSTIKQLDGEMSTAPSARTSSKNLAKMPAEMIKNDRGEIVLLEVYLLEKTYQI
jgi:hypothetical protein